MDGMMAHRIRQSENLPLLEKQAQSARGIFVSGLRLFVFPPNL